MTAKAGILPLRATAMGTVTSVAGANANGFTVGVANPTSTPTITVGTSLIGLMVGDGTAATALPFPGGTTTFLRADGSFATPASGTGTVTSVSVVSANGLAGTVATATTTPAITLTTSITGLLKGNGTAISAATSGTDYVIPSGTVANVTGIVLGANGGTGIANTGKTITLGGNLTTSGTFASTFTMTNTTGVTFPSSGTLLSTAAAVTVAQGGTSLGTLTTGGVFIGQGTGTPSFVVPGTAGNVLTSVAGVWASQAPAGASGLVCIAVQTVSSNVSAVDFTSVMSSTYDRYQLDFCNVTPDVDDTLQIQLSSDNGATWHTTYQTAGIRNLSSSATPASDGAATAASTIVLSTSQVRGAASSAGANGVFNLFDPAGISSLKGFTWQLSIYNNSSQLTNTSGAGVDNTGNSAINAIRVRFGSNNVAGGVMHLYGYRKTV